MKIKILLSLLALTFLTSIRADQTVFGQVAKDSPYEDGAPAGSSSHLGNVEDYYGKMKADSTPEQESEKDKEVATQWMKKIKGESYNIPHLKDNKYLEFRNKNLVKNLYKRSKSSWGFLYISDSYDYNDRKDIFEKTFGSQSGEDSVQSGYLFGQYKYNWYRGFVDLYTEADLGLSYNSGNGRFADDNTESETTLRLWVIPFDALAGIKVNFGRYVGLSLSAGPSFVALMQNRSDREEGDEGKDVRQFGYGYTALSSLEVSLSQLFHDFGMHLRSKSDVTDMSLALTMRNTSISNFKNEDVEIVGTSIGLGFKFEYL